MSLDRQVLHATLTQQRLSSRLRQQTETSTTDQSLHESAPSLHAQLLQRGPQGPPGLDGATTTTVTAAMNVPAFHVVALDINGEAYLADADTLADAERVLGLSLTAALVGEEFKVQTGGLLVMSGLTVGAVYLGHGGELVADPTPFVFDLQVGEATSATELIVRLEAPIYA